MATPASQAANKAKDHVSQNMKKQLDGPLKTMHSLEDKFSAVKQLHVSTYPVINGAKKALDAMAMSDTTSGNPPGTAAALATIATHVGLTSSLKKLASEYAKVKMKMLQPVEFAKTKLSGELGIDQSQFDDDGYFGSIRDGNYSLEPDQDLIDEVNSTLEEEGGKFDYSIDVGR